MSYTLRGRIESRLAAAVPALLAALALHRWWAIELVALMLAIGLLLDAAVYHRALPYQPGWLALPLGLLELGLVYGAMRGLALAAPLRPALGLFALGWLGAQILGHALFPRLRLEYAQGGGELGRLGVVTSLAVVVTVTGGIGAAYAVQPPTVHLRGIVRGPLVIRHAQTLVGGVVQGGIVILADNVTLRDVTVQGGENGIDIENADRIALENVRVTGPALDGIHIRGSSVMIDGCTVSSPAGPWVQGIDISFSMHKAMSMIRGCTIVGVREGIVTHMSKVDVEGNRIGATSLRAVTMGEMSMGRISGNEILGATGVGIICLDRSECEIDDNTITGTKRDPTDPQRGGVAIQAHFLARAELDGNTIVSSPGGVEAIGGATITRR